jgi:cytochrome c
MRWARTQLVVGCAFAFGIGLSTVHPFGNPRTETEPASALLAGSEVPGNVRASLEAKCGNCHSRQTRYPLYAHIAPVSWMIDRDIVQGRSKLNLSEWQSMNDESRISALTRLASVIHAGEMPPWKYVMLHPGARLSPNEQQGIYDWAKSERRRLRDELNHRSDRSAVGTGTEKP